MPGYVVYLTENELYGAHLCSPYPLILMLSGSVEVFSEFSAALSGIIHLFWVQHFLQRTLCGTYLVPVSRYLTYSAMYSCYMFVGPLNGSPSGSSVCLFYDLSFILRIKIELNERLGPYLSQCRHPGIGWDVTGRDFALHL